MSPIGLWKLGGRVVDGYRYLRTHWPSRLGLQLRFGMCAFPRPLRSVFLEHYTPSYRLMSQSTGWEGAAGDNHFVVCLGQPDWRSSPRHRVDFLSFNRVLETMSRHTNKG